MKTRWTRSLSLLIFLTTLFLSADAFAQETGKKDKNEDKEVIVEKGERDRLKKDAERAKEVFISKNADLEQQLNEAVGYVIFPNVGKGAWILGGAAGNGVVYENGNVIGFAELRQIDIGFQFGGQAFRELIVFNTQEALNVFKEGNMNFEGSASAVVWDKGAGETIQFENGVGVALMPKAGAMVGISVGGQEFDYREID